MFWFRRDLRITDNAGLYRALKSNEKVIPVFIFDTVILDELEDMLPPKTFFRANRQFLLNIKCIRDIHTDNNKLRLTLQPSIDEDVVVSRERAPEFKAWMGK